MHALDQMYSSHPAVMAARSVLHSQLLSGGVQLVRDGEPLKQVKFGEKGDNGKAKQGITKDFQQHLEEHWIPFARDVVDSFLKWGLVPVVFEAIEEDTHAKAMSALKRELEELLHRHFASPAEYKATPEHWVRIGGAFALWALCLAGWVAGSLPATLALPFAQWLLFSPTVHEPGLG